MRVVELALAVMGFLLPCWARFMVVGLTRWVSGSVCGCGVRSFTEVVPCCRVLQVVVAFLS